MSYCVRLMHREHIAQVAEIDRQVFPTLWPLANYRYEIQNRMARYIVVCDEERGVEPAEVQAVPRKGLAGVITRVSRFLNSEPPSSMEYIAGFIGFWIMADEARIVNIAVRETDRRQGIGELLLISTIDLAIELKAHTITLEVRVSNTAAQALYCKYGFTQVDIRGGYYVDNKEDAILMATGDISSTLFQSHLQQLKQANSGKLGSVLYQVVQ